MVDLVVVVGVKARVGVDGEDVLIIISACLMNDVVCV